MDEIQPSEISYPIWMEGYNSVESRAAGKAEFLGDFKATSFADACKKACENKGWNMNHYAEKSNTYWGCRFFEDEESARKAYG